MRRLQTTVAIGKEQFGVTVQLPELPQGSQRRRRQGHEAVPVAFGVAYLYAHPGGIDVADFQGQPFAQAQPQAVEGEIEHPVAQGARRQKQALRFVDRNDVGQALRLGRLDQVRHHPGLLQDMGGVELQAVEIELDRAPRVCPDQVAEVLGELRLGEVVDLLGKVLTQPPDSTGVGVDGLGLQPLEFEMLEMGLVLPVEVPGQSVRHAGLSSRNIAESLPSTARK